LQAAGFGVQIETTYRAYQLGFRVYEAPIVFRDRRAGVSKITAGIVAEALLLPWRMRATAEQWLVASEERTSTNR
jgi:dolichol-phosphate mannosyltransferase